MHVNNRGFSVVELLVSFILVSIIVSGMMIIVVQYERRAVLSNTKLDMVKVKADITRSIYNDIKNENLALSNVETCDNDQNCIKLSFINNGKEETKKIRLVKDEKYITYGDMIFYFNKNSEIGNLNLSDGVFYKITLDVYNMDIEGNYGLDIVIPKPNSNSS